MGAYRDVITGRSFAWASSPMSEEPDTMQVGMPNPRIIRATMYMPTMTRSHTVSRGSSQCRRAVISAYRAARIPG